MSEELGFHSELDRKKTEIGELPIDWKVVSLGQIVEEINVRNETKEDFPVFAVTKHSGLVPSLGYFKKRVFSQELHKYKVVSKNQFVYSPIHLNEGAIGLLEKEEKGLVSPLHVVFELLSDEYPSFFNYLLKSKRLLSIYTRLPKGSVNRRGAISFRDFCRILVQLPTIKEQHGIVKVLSCVDLAIRKTDDVIIKTERLKKSLLQKLLAEGIGHKEFKDTEIGKIPKEWNVVKLETVSNDFIGGGTPSTSKPEYWNGEIPWMTSAHITGRIITNGQKYITKKGLENSSTNIVPRGNLLVATRVGIGKAAVNMIDVAISQDLTGVVIDKSKVSSGFLYWFITGNGKRLKSLAQGSTIKGVLREDLGKMSIPYPPVSEQEGIAEMLTCLEKKLELERKEKPKLERIKQSVMDLLLSGKVRVKVD